MSEEPQNKQPQASYVIGWSACGPSWNMKWSAAAIEDIRPPISPKTYVQLEVGSPPHGNIAGRAPTFPDPETGTCQRNHHGNFNHVSSTSVRKEWSLQVEDVFSLEFFPVFEWRVIWVLCRIQRIIDDIMIIFLNFIPIVEQYTQAMLFNIYLHFCWWGEDQRLPWSPTAVFFESPHWDEETRNSPSHWCRFATELYLDVKCFL